MSRSPKFLQIHTLTSYGASLLNRDQDGFAKRLPFGGTRLRVSSQCLKRHWRSHQGPLALSTIPLGEGVAPMSIRSRVTFRELIRDRLVREESLAPSEASTATESLLRFILSENPKTEEVEEEGPKKPKKGKGKAEEEAPTEEPADTCRTSQITILGPAEVDFLYQELRTVLRKTKTERGATLPSVLVAHFTPERRKNLRGLLLGAGLDAALFGRMVTSKNLDNIDAAIQVAHSFTVHLAQTESDFFSAVDDLEQELGNKGSGHIGNLELTTGLYYGYVAVDLPLLHQNLTGQVDKRVPNALLSEVVRRLVHLIATVSPGAKLGSTAPHAYSQFVLVEQGVTQPRTLGNAFLRPVTDNGELLARAYEALKIHLGEMEQMFGPLPDSRFAAMGPVEKLGLAADRRLTLPELASWASEQ